MLISRRPILASTLVVSVAAAVLATGCSGPAPAPDPAPSPVSAPSTSPVPPTPQPVPPTGPAPSAPGDAGDTADPAPPSKDPGSAPSGAPSPADPPTSADDRPFAMRPGTIDGARVKASVFPVTRAGGTATVNVMIASDDPNRQFWVGGALSDGNRETGAAGLDSVDGLRLVDVKSKKLYLPAVTGAGRCACSPDGTEVWVRTTLVWVSVVFAAPPTDLTAIDVQVPQFGTFTGVPLS